MEISMGEEDQWTRSFSWSKMSTYNRCPRQFRYQYIEDIEEDISDERRDDGIDFHDYAEEYYSQLSNPVEGPTVDHAVGLAQDMFPEMKQAKYRPFIENWHQWNLHIYKVWGDEHWTPVMTEKWVEVEIDGETHHGYIDRIQWNPNKEEYMVIDYKPKARDGSRIKGQTAYYGSFLLNNTDLLDKDVNMAGTFGYRDGGFKQWDIHWASEKATKRKIDALKEYQDGFSPNFDMHCDWCSYQETCTMKEAEDDGLLNL